jgi:hypothetical protein
MTLVQKARHKFAHLEDYTYIKLGNSAPEFLMGKHAAEYRCSATDKRTEPPCKEALVASSSLPRRCVTMIVTSGEREADPLQRV